MFTSPSEPKTIPSKINKSNVGTPIRADTRLRIVQDKSTIADKIIRAVMDIIKRPPSGRNATYQFIIPYSSRIRDGLGRENCVRVGILSVE